jgi:hypothetical protein
MLSYFVARLSESCGTTLRRAARWGLHNEVNSGDLPFEGPERCMVEGRQKDLESHARRGDQRLDGE